MYLGLIDVIKREENTGKNLGKTICIHWWNMVVAACDVGMHGSMKSGKSSFYRNIMKKHVYFFDILLTVHLNIFILILTNLMH